MGKFIVTGVVSGFLILGGSLVSAKDIRVSGEHVVKHQTQVEKKQVILSFEQRLNLKPLSDDELEQITAAGLGPAMPFPFQPFLFLPFLFSKNNFLNLGLSTGPQVQNNFQSQGFNFPAPVPFSGIR